MKAQANRLDGVEDWQARAEKAEASLARVRALCDESWAHLNVAEVRAAMKEPRP